jgi:hypothetical protein
MQWGLNMAKYNMPEQEANKVFSRVLGDMDIVGAIETIMGVNEREENNDITVDKDLQDIKEQLAEVKAEIAQVKASSLYNQMLGLLESGHYGMFMNLMHGVTEKPISLGQELFDDLITTIGNLYKWHEEEAVPNCFPLNALKHATKRYAKRNNLNTEKLEHL